MIATAESAPSPQVSHFGKSLRYSYSHSSRLRVTNTFHFESHFIAKFLSEQFSQVPLLAADGSFVQYDKTAPILELPHTHTWLAWEEMLQAPWKAVKDRCDPRVTGSLKEG